MAQTSTDWFAQAEQPYRILVIDDEEVIHLSIKRLLRKHPVIARAAHSPAEGLRLAAAYPWDLLLIDLMMPGMNGFELLEALREAGVSTPVAVISAYATPEMASRVLRCEVVDFVPKPFTRHELFTVIALALRPRGGRPKPQRSGRGGGA